MRVESLREPAENATPIDLSTFALQLVAQRVHEDFGIGVTFEVIIAVGEEVVFQLLEIRELAVECDGEPLGFPPVFAFKRLGVIAVGGATRGVTHVSNRGGSVDPIHDRLELDLLVHSKRFRNRAELLVRLQERRTVRMEARHAGGELPAVLHIEQHAREHSRRTRRIPFDWDKSGDGLTSGVMDGCDSALVVDFAHELECPDGRLLPSCAYPCVRGSPGPSCPIDYNHLNIDGQPWR